MNAIIIDDTKTAIDNLAEKLQRYDDINLVATADNGADGLERVRQCKPDLLFLDIELPDMTGITFLERMKEVGDNRCRVVIYTAYNDYMLPAFRNKAFDFLLKPIDDGELDTIINRFYTEYRSGNREIGKKGGVISRNDGRLLFYTNTVDFRLIQVCDICVFCYDHESRVWTVVTAGGEKPMRLKRNVSKDALLKLSPNFVQVSQKCIININYLMEVRDNVCFFYPPFDDIDFVKVGRFFRRKLISRYNAI